MNTHIESLSSCWPSSSDIKPFIKALTAHEPVIQQIESLLIDLSGMYTGIDTVRWKGFRDSGRDQCMASQPGGDQSMAQWAPQLGR